jgi:type IV pilus assembly protein PilM
VYSGGPKPAGVGVDIGSHATKIVVAQRQADRVAIVAVANCDVPHGLVEGGVVRNPKLLGRLIQQHIPSDFRGAPAIVSIPSNLAALRWLTLPNLEGEELRQAAKYKVKRHLPFPVEGAYVSASKPAVEEGEAAGQSLVMAVPRAVVESRAETLLAAEMEPAGAELEAQAILRVVERKLNDQSVLWRDASLTIIDLGGLQTHMYVVQNQRLQFIRGVKFGGDLVAQAVARELEVETPLAEVAIANSETELSPDGVLSLEGEDLRLKVDVSGELDKLNREFLRLLRYFRSLHPERSYAGILDHVIVCGGLAGLKGFAEYLERALALRVERASPLAGAVANLRTGRFETILNRQETFTVVMGLALASLERSDRYMGVINAEREFVWARSA